MSNNREARQLKPTQSGRGHAIGSEANNLNMLWKLTDTKNRRKFCQRLEMSINVDEWRDYKNSLYETRLFMAIKKKNEPQPS